MTHVWADTTKELTTMARETTQTLKAKPFGFFCFLSLLDCLGFLALIGWLGFPGFLVRPLGSPKG